MILAPCHSRREFPDKGTTFFCAHPNVHANGQLVTAEVCQICNHWKKPPPIQYRHFDPAGALIRRTGPCFFLGDQTGWRQCPTCIGNVQLKVFACRHLLHESTTYDECRGCSDYEQPLSSGAVRHWAVGMTTAPREQPTLKRTLESLAEAGWSDLRLFAEPAVQIPGEFSETPVTWRESRVGAFPNWLLALGELLMREPLADAYFLCQDDVLFARGLRDYLEERLWPAERLGVVSIYGAGSQSTLGPEGFHLDVRGADFAGALAVIFPGSAARMFHGHPLVMNHRQRNGEKGLYQIDVLIGQWSVQTGLPMYTHAPSLAQHIGETSTLFPGAGNNGQRRARTFAEEL